MGYRMTMVLDKNNDLWVWGYNSNAELGIGTTGNYYTPILQKDYHNDWPLSGKTIAKLCRGYHTNSVITDEGDVYVWGDGNQGQLLSAWPYKFLVLYRYNG